MPSGYYTPKNADCKLELLLPNRSLELTFNGSIDASLGCNYFGAMLFYSLGGFCHNVPLY